MTRKRKKLETINSGDSLNEKKPFKRKEVIPKTEGQKLLLETICENQITLCLGPAGTGKGHIAIGYAVGKLVTGQIDRIILSRPIIPGGGEDMGHLPGSSDDKIAPYLQPLLDELGKFSTQGELKQWKAEKKIDFIPLSHTRGRTYDNAVVIYDETQNTNKEQLKMMLTRIGSNCKMIILGDIEQSDLRNKDQGAFKFCFDRLTGEVGIGTVTLTEKDIVRNEIIGRILRRLKE